MLDASAPGQSDVKSSVDDAANDIRVNVKTVSKDVKKVGKDVKAVGADVTALRAEMQALRQGQLELVQKLMQAFLEYGGSHVPCMAVLIPRDKTWKEEKVAKWAKDMFQLHLSCEAHGHEHLMHAASDSATLVPGYEVEMPKPLVASCAPYLFGLLKLAQMALKLMPISSPSISDETIANVDACGKNLCAELPDVQKDIDKAHKARREKSKSKSSMDNACAEIEIKIAVGDDDSTRNAVAVRQLQAWVQDLEGIDRSTFQGLTRVLDSSRNKYVWCCAEHAKSLFNHQAPPAEAAAPVSSLANVGLAMSSDVTPLTDRLTDATAACIHRSHASTIS